MLTFIFSFQVQESSSEESLEVKIVKRNRHVLLPSNLQVKFVQLNTNRSLEGKRSKHLRIWGAIRQQGIGNVRSGKLRITAASLFLRSTFNQSTPEQLKSKLIFFYTNPFDEIKGVF